MVLQEIHASIFTCCIYRTSSILHDAKPNVSYIDIQPGAASAVFAAVHTAMSATAGLSLSDG